MTKRDLLPILPDAAVLLADCFVVRLASIRNSNVWHVGRIIEHYMTSLHRSIPHPQPLSRRARGASSETGLSPGFVILDRSAAEVPLTTDTQEGARHESDGIMRQALRLLAGWRIIGVRLDFPYR